MQISLLPFDLIQMHHLMTMNLHANRPLDQQMLSSEILLFVLLVVHHHRMGSMSQLLLFSVSMMTVHHPIQIRVVLVVLEFQVKNAFHLHAELD